MGRNEPGAGKAQPSRRDRLRPLPRQKRRKPAAQHRPHGPALRGAPQGGRPDELGLPRLPLRRRSRRPARRMRRIDGRVRRLPQEHLPSGAALLPGGRSMTYSPVAEALIKAWEKLRLTAYRDEKGVWTIGWGTTSKA